MEDSYLFYNIYLYFKREWKVSCSYSLSLLLFRMGKMASCTLALWTWQLWEIEWGVKKDDGVSGKHTVPQLSPAVFFSAIGLWWIKNTATSRHHELQVDPNFSIKSNYTMSSVCCSMGTNKCLHGAETGLHSFLISLDRPTGSVSISYLSAMQFIILKEFTNTTQLYMS